MEKGKIRNRKGIHQLKKRKGEEGRQVQVSEGRRGMHWKKRGGEARKGRKEIRKKWYGKEKKRRDGK